MWCVPSARYRNRKAAVTALCVLLILAVVTIAVLYNQNTDRKMVAARYVTDGETVEYDKAIEYWQERVEQSDMEVAKNEFIHAGNSLAVGQAHVLAHAFGRAVFNAYGVSGMPYCPDNFSYGCVHQFLGTALLELGIGSLKSIHETCVGSVGKGATGCAHAMGHGIVGYFGYSFANLGEGMHACDELEPAGPYSKCLSGAFMEFNFRELGLSVSSFVTPRPISTDNVFAPCDVLPSGYAEACFRQLPLWWSTVIEEDNPEKKYRRYGEFCRDAGKINSDVSESCFMGVGFAAAIDADLSGAVANSFCSIASRTERERALCLADAAYKLKIAGVQNAVDLCNSSDLSLKNEEYCQWRIAL